ncbi:flavin reductase family protein [Streptomyces sp. SID13666]|nr:MULTISPECIES: flavin reductase family protein [unclassified Streptomyces]NEA55121.1 flavin reductase family protein [Streptomyces sp. SID13666]NEA71128.1 flavin reductase family protein [Streptomyces sp. SID13588]
MIVAETEERDAAAVEARVLREVCGRYPTGVAVITCQGSEEGPVGITVNSFTSVSLDPALVLFCVHRESRALAAVQASGAFAVNILASDQAALCRAFARRDTADFGELPHGPGATGSPVLVDALAFLDCRLHTTFPGGDHMIVIGEVVDLGLLREDQPLTFFRSAHPRLEVLA